jgi:hypothetical protein
MHQSILAQAKEREREAGYAGSLGTRARLAVTQNTCGPPARPKQRLALSLRISR